MPKHNAKPDNEEIFGAFKMTGTEDLWIIDSGASSHMSRTLDHFVDYEKFEEPQKIFLGDGCAAEAHGKSNSEHYRRPANLRILICVVLFMCRNWHVICFL
jgi:hypothetical protein